ncbi:PCYCGC motif-containing (lipo)protein [Candidatus Methanoperedens nitratireducens]|uniref:Uncharacterized protein n=1 Tax=Candidatus Methanoperedens nitratireducens TaxID=1392998 RepID=A0A284VL52_9EURY|nr:PCYCGC motif-containing (lipo)protein [Candidatus Methanoperedens nitroreducens]SNQ59994.1 hypothetical protein MNV_1500008 [Candidatus Methanoperedens nitroreducens]
MKPEKKATNVKEKSKKVSKKRGNSTLIIGVVAVIMLAGGYILLSGGGSSQDPATTNQLKLPSFAYKDAMTLKAYTYATKHPEMLEQIPCYCGCGGHGSAASDGKAHRFLRDCFINDNWQYDDHGSNCDTCLALASKTQDYLAAGKTLKEARELIDREYQGKYPDSMPTNTDPVRDDYIPVLKPRDSGLTGTASTPATPVKVDLSGYSLPGNFNSLADGLNLTPAGANRAYFINTKIAAGTELENMLAGNLVQPDSFYGKKIIGMYSTDFSTSSWIEMHDLGYDTTKDTTIKARVEQGMKNTVYTRPLVYGHSQNVDNVLKLMSNPKSMQTSYQTYKPLLDAVDYKNVAYAQVITESGNFSDISYTSMTPVNGKVELVKAFNVTDNKSIPAELDKYTPQTTGKVLVIKMTGDLTTVQKESDNIDTIART